MTEQTDNRARSHSLTAGFFHGPKKDHGFSVTPVDRPVCESNKQIQIGSHHHVANLHQKNAQFRGSIADLELHFRVVSPTVRRKPRFFFTVIFAPAASRIATNRSAKTYRPDSKHSFESTIPNLCPANLLTTTMHSLPAPMHIGGLSATH